MFRFEGRVLPPPRPSAWILFPEKRAGGRNLLPPRYSEWMVIASGLAIPSGWLLQVDGYPEWTAIASGLAIPSGWLLQVDGYSESTYFLTYFHVFVTYFKVLFLK